MRLIDIDKFPLLPNKLGGDESEYERGYHDATANLNALPTIDPESLRPKGEWISVEDRLPEYDQVVLCYKDDRGVRIGKHMPATYADGVVAFNDLARDYAFGVTHWMPLPKPPGADMRGET